MSRQTLIWLALVISGGCGSPEPSSHEVPVSSGTARPAPDGAAPPATRPPRAIATH